ncbi:RraA family protein [Paenibacillus spongiae]|uniref:Putative 4-hydroxy-4-methyl-2-oxoglutarate aldolase n=1 Tax=Paenibacillus spongiae TaxID=2909671 RepID=A0ABY5S352_9BACL|nr:RraA family protein [Paenibacillus spongiae]UVI28311.1 RraA family protein [Paenibacillus spongiae]
MNEKELFDRMTNELYTAVICDALDEVGYRNQSLKSGIVPLDHNWVVTGRAKTIHAVDVSEVHGNPYDKEIKAVDSIKENEVVVVCTNDSEKSGIWGELLSTAAKVRGGRGAIVDGLIRDSKKIIDMNFPVFTKGMNPLDSQGRTYVIDYDVAVTCGGVTIYPNDVIFADRDGIAVIPHAVLNEVLDKAFRKVNRENSTRDELLAGKYLQDVYDKYGVL